MALSEKSRSELYQALEGLAGPEAVEEMLSYFPARDVEEPVTREHLDRRFAEVQTSMAELRTELQTSVAELRTELHTSIAEVKTSMAELRTESQTSIAELRTEMNRLHNRLLIEVTAVVGVVAALLRLSLV